MLLVITVDHSVLLLCNIPLCEINSFTLFNINESLGYFWYLPIFDNTSVNIFVHVLSSKGMYLEMRLLEYRV